MLRVLVAHTPVAAAVSAVITRQMARALLDGTPVNLLDEVACLIRLSCAGFGAPSIAALHAEARAQAGMWLKRRDRPAGSLAID